MIKSASDIIQSVNESMCLNEISAKFTYGPLIDMLKPKNWGASPIYTGDFESKHEDILKKVDWCKTSADISYLRSDLRCGIPQLEKIKQNLQNALDNPDDNKSLYIEMRKRNKKGLTVEKIDSHIKWLREVYAKAITEKAKSIKK